MTRRSGGRALLWVGMGCGGAALAVLVLGGGVAAQWALGYLGPKREADVASAKPAAPAAPVLPALPALPAPTRGRLSAANCEKLKLRMTEAEVKALLGPPAGELQLFDVRGAGGLAERLAEQWPTKGLSYAEGGEVVLWVYLNRTGQLVMVAGAVEGKAIFMKEPTKDPFDNLRPGQMPPPFERFPANPFMPGGAAPPPGAPPR
jgi:hypothetical protein